MAISLNIYVTVNDAGSVNDKSNCNVKIYIANY